MTGARPLADVLLENDDARYEADLDQIMELPDHLRKTFFARFRSEHQQLRAENEELKKYVTHMRLSMRPADFQALDDTVDRGSEHCEGGVKRPDAVKKILAAPGLRLSPSELSQDEAKEM